MTSKGPIATAVTRRAALLGAGALAGCAPLAKQPAVTPQPAATGLFRHGVASGDPLSDRIILWTRVTTQDAAVPVRWSVARDADFAEVVAEGEAQATETRDWTVKVEATGLEPGTEYVYRFEAEGGVSPVGRTRTLPQGASGRLRLAVVSCSNHPAGFFHVYRAIADRGEADLVVHLGDYIYEYGAAGYATAWGEDNRRIPDPPHEILTLADYRRRHAQYKADPDLQAAHAAAPWLMIWDDHETANDAWTGGADNHGPDEGPWTQRRDASLRAYYEWTPTREPEGDAINGLGRSVALGNLGVLVLLEARHGSRSKQITWDDAPVPYTANHRAPEVREALTAFLRDRVGAPDRTLIGPAQMARAEAALAEAAAAGKPWPIVASPVMLAQSLSPDFEAAAPAWLRTAIRFRQPDAWRLMRRSAAGVPLGLDQWDGYPAERARLYDAFARAGVQPIVISGDAHRFSVCRLVDDRGRAMGVELNTSAVSSPSPFRDIPDVGVDYDGLTEAANPHMLHHDAIRRGYVALELTPETARAEIRVVDTVEEPTFTESVSKVFEMRRGAAGELMVEDVSIAVREA